ncbi:DUF6279 family lipoprotein [Pseudoteredinibacter isoporae]|uniref:Lipoprotein n=1 Tax=Pseudoteredinibacter isoporae TaxID=570281 RepID=A0A7X0MY90_9GAMM|nr:DUF6279 family lipoprotein [Pseudoteredinibacter isoporae]MBB6522814.1 hypothetical protein [Pseudoteredinibacter isoporae]NHO88341.1 hypothetical protein [Pseudoteredinibacter isoporae]NIB23328.1 hypothetical protein [Pseudoteredinibacter isoporae]
MTISRRLILLSALLLLSACSTQYAYRLADWWLENQVEEYLDLNREQQKQLSNAIDEWHVWHQKEELPRYRSLLDNLQQALNQDSISTEQIAAFEEDATAVWKRLLHKGGPLLAELTLAQDQKQRQYLYKQIEANNDELREKFSDRSEQERRERGREGMEKQVRETLGKLNDAQKQKIQQWSETFMLGAEIELAQRLHWQERFRDILEGPRTEDSQTQLLALFENPRSEWSKEKLELEDHNRILQRQLLSDLFQLSDEKQKKRLHKQISKYQDLLEKMAKQKL